MPDTRRQESAPPGRPEPGAGGGSAALPRAVVRPERRPSLAWIVPVLAVVFAGWLVLAAWRERGVAVSVQLTKGHGLKVGDPVRYRGITVGEVRDLTLGRDLRVVEASVRLRPRATALARAGTRFWVVRPRLRLSGIEGLETLLGPRYLAVMPAAVASGDAPRQREFIALAEPPVVTDVEPGDLEIVLEATRRGSVRRGAPVTYRQIRVGTVLSVGLASDGSIVEARVHIRTPYRSLIRSGTRFWDVGGVRADFGLGGLSVEIESLQDLLMGGIALATPGPDEAGSEVHTGHRFPLDAEPEASWLEWEPNVPIGSSLLPPGSTRPRLLRASIGWKQGFIVKGTHTRRGWVLQTERGLLGPADLLAPQLGRTADRETIEIEVAGKSLPLEGEPAWTAGGLARLDATVSDRPWPQRLMRAASGPEDCIAVADPGAAPIPLAASRLVPVPGGWLVDAAVSIDALWHGAGVVSRADGRLVGILLVDNDDVRVALIETAAGTR